MVFLEEEGRGQNIPSSYRKFELSSIHYVCTVLYKHNLYYIVYCPTNHTIAMTTAVEWKMYFCSAYDDVRNAVVAYAHTYIYIYIYKLPRITYNEIKSMFPYLIVFFDTVRIELQNNSATDTFVIYLRRKYKRKKNGENKSTD
jgi:hypothetical protein